MDTDQIIVEQFIKKHPAQAAQTLEKLQDDQIAALIEKMPISVSLHLLDQLKTHRGAKYLQLLPSDLAKEIIENIDITQAESLLRQCELSFRTKLLDNLPPKLAGTLRQKLAYEIDTVGEWMIPSVFALEKQVLVKDAIEIVKLEKERISSTIYVINNDDVLEGAIKMQHLIFADPQLQLASIMVTEIPRLIAELPLRVASNHPGWLKYRSIPVVDGTEKLVGLLDFETVQKVKTETSQELSKEILATSSTLGELYRIGLTGFLQSISK